MTRGPALFFALALASVFGVAAADTGASSTDEQITAQVRDAIFHRPELVGDDVSVQTQQGVVYLRGLVDTNVEREAIEKIARLTPGVQRIVDSLEMRNRR